jgi:hypothetical protein
MSAGLADNCARLAHARKRLTHPWGQQPQAGLRVLCQRSQADLF